MYNDLKKQLNDLKAKIYKDIKPTNCLLCGNVMTSPCNSHTVPQFVLKTIAKNGKVCYGQALAKIKEIDTETGIGNAFPFKLICRKCDNSFFKEYESSESILYFDGSKNNNRILAPMAVKSHLGRLSSKLYIKRFKERMYLNGYENPNLSGEKLEIVQHRVYIKNLKKLKNSSKEEFTIIFNDLLDYEVGIACQTTICLVRDLDGNLLFDMLDIRFSNKLDFLYLTIFPTEGKTRIMLFVENSHIERNLSFIYKFDKLDLEDKIHAIFIMLILYSEQFYMNPKLKDIILKDKALCKIYKKSDNDGKGDKVFKCFQDFRKYNNYLLEKYSLQSLQH